MTQDEIIEMVMQISGCDRPEYDSPALKMFEAFAKLVAAKEQKKWEDQTAVEIHEAVLEEREACAQVAFSWNHEITDLVAEEIRARGEQS